jgi:hypothetical protein
MENRDCDEKHHEDRERRTQHKQEHAQGCVGRFFHTCANGLHAGSAGLEKREICMKRWEHDDFGQGVKASFCNLQDAPRGIILK